MSALPLKKKQKKNTFILKNIDPITIEKRYNLQSIIQSNIIPQSSFNPDNQSSPLERSHLSLAPKTELTNQLFFSFIDDSKQFCITMVDSITNQSILCQTCYWCRTDFSTHPIGCPLKYVSKTIVKKCQSEITKQFYTVEQSIPRSIQLPESDTTRTINHDYYETDGSFCSFNCCMSYINDHRTNPYYNNSKQLLMKMYIELFKPLCPPNKIIPSPHWRLLKTYGGHMDIEEFRSSYVQYLYIDKECSITQIPNVIPYGKIFEQVYIF